MIKVLFLGDVVGIPTVKKMKKKLGEVISEKKIDFTIANGDGASDGYGILKRTAYDLFDCGVDVITGGDFIFNKKDAKDLLRYPFVLRPFNLPGSLGGRGASIYKIQNDIQIGVINLLGRTNINKIFPMDPFYSANLALEKLSNDTNIIIIDFHGGTTSEIQAMHWYMAGRVSMVAGTHLKVITSDNRILKDKTAVITGAGYCGGNWSIGGLYPQIEIKKIKYGQFMYSKVVKDSICLQGVIVEIDEKTGEARSIELYKQII